MISRPVVRLAASATAVLAMSSLAACSDDPDAMPAASAATSATDPTPTPTESAEPTEPSVSEVATGSVTSDQIADLFTTAMGSISTADVSMSMESTAAGAMTIEGEIDMTKTPADISMSMDMSSMGFGMVDALMVDGTMYMNLGELSQNMYVTMSPDDLDASGLDVSVQMDPNKSLGQFVDGFQSGEYLGTEAEGDHYRIVISTAELGPDDIGAFGAVPDTVTMDLWFAADLFSKAFVDMGPAGTWTMTYSNWGEPVDITAPDPSQITTVPGM